MNSVNFPGLATSRLKLRQLSLGDDQAIFDMRSNKEVNKLIDRKTCETIDEAREFILKIINSETSSGFYWAIDLKESNTLAGTICLFNIDESNGKCEIGFELLPGFQSRGIMHEAAQCVIDFVFHTMKFTQIEGFTNPANANSIKLLEKLKFELSPDQDVPNYLIYSLNVPVIS